MQPPPPRKGGNYAKFLKSLHTEQLNKLQIKNQYECELLEDIRNFTKQRSAIEKSYAEALLKISSVYLNKKIPNIPDIKLDGGEEKWNMWNVWRTVLEENEKLAKARLAAVEVFQQKVSDDAKILRTQKLQYAKKNLDQLQNVQKELQITVQDVDRHKKFYFDEEYSAHDVRDKAKDIEEKLKKKKGSFFTSITSLQKNSAKFSTKREIMDQRSTGARNDYLLSLSAANAHQNRYFVIDLQQTMLNMENNVFEKVQEYLMYIARTELLTCSATQTSFTRIRDQANKLTRDYNLQCCYLFFPVLKQHITYDFEACCNDPVTIITVTDPSTATITKETKRLCTKLGRESINIRECNKKLHMLLTARDAGQRVDPNDPNGPDIDTKIEELRQMIRRSETSKMKTEAKIECLKNGGVNVEEFLQDVENLSTLELPRSGSQLSVRTDASGAEQCSSDSFYDDSDFGEQENLGADQQTSQDNEEDVKAMQDAAEVEAMMEAERAKIEQMTAAWDDPTHIEWGNEEFPPAENQTNVDEVCYKCTALYNYTAQNPDELSIIEGEELEVLSGADYDAGDGWLRARNQNGDEGFVPQNYLDFPDTNEIQVQANEESEQSPVQNGMSFSSVDYTIEQHKQEITKVSSIDRKDIPAPLDLKKTDEFDYYFALYDYKANAPEEISFEEGAIVRVLKRREDGWFEGELLIDDGSAIKGLFPTMVMQRCDANGDPLSSEESMSPPDSAPPMGSPPKFLLENLNPSEENELQFNNNKGPSVEELENEAENEEFSMKLTQGQNKKYNKQFSENEVSIEEAAKGQVVPTVCIEIHEDIYEEEDEETVNLTANLNPAQIVITAATPMIEEAEPFPDPPAETLQDEQNNGETENTATENSSIDQQTEIEIESPPSITKECTTQQLPDELEIQQLAKLSSLKESDA